MVEENKMGPLLSVVIIGLNEAERIGQCIDSIRAAVAHIPDAEIVYVDSGSSDETVSIALSKDVRVFRLGKAQAPSPAAGRYVGSLVTSGQFIMFVDGDTIIAPGWIEPAIELMMRDTSIVMFAGTLCNGQQNAKVAPAKVEHLGVISPVHEIGTDCAPIVSRQALDSAGNWNPFLRCWEEADLAIRFRHYIPGSQVIQCNQCTVNTPKCSILYPREIIRRWKRGFFKGPGQILRNAIAHGYLSKSWGVTKSAVLAIAFLVALAVSIALKLWWQFLLLFFGMAFLRAVITRKLRRLVTVFHSLLLGICSLWEFATVPVRRASDYKHDFMEIHEDIV
jgi:glycosyltransferase involved in cell wall biosynthesis